MVRAYADDMAIILQSLENLPKISLAFEMLQRASALAVNIQKTVFVPLYAVDQQQARADLSGSSWAGMEI